MVYFIFTQYQGVSIFKKKSNIFMYVYNKNYCCILQISTKTQLLRLVNCSCIKLVDISKKFYKKTKHTYLSDIITSFLTQFNLLKNAKIKFAGKGYKIRKNSRQSLLFLFNRAHMTVMCWRNLVLKRIKKYKFYVRFNLKNIQVIKTILSIRRVNIFTKRGLRKSRQVLLKKKGKK